MQVCVPDLVLTNCEDGTGELEMEIKAEKLQQNEVI